MVRANLLKDMKLAVTAQSPPLDLNFIYGKLVGEKFIPLDGQQRLTTLYLLYLYAFRAVSYTHLDVYKRQYYDRYGINFSNRLSYL